MVPHRRWDLGLERGQVLRLGRLLQLRHAHHGCPLRVMTRTPPAVSFAKASFSRSSPELIRFFRSAMNAAASTGLASAA